jgi:hypothetical protein
MNEGSGYRLVPAGSCTSHTSLAVRDRFRVVGRLQPGVTLELSTAQLIVQADYLLLLWAQHSERLRDALAVERHGRPAS